MILYNRMVVDYGPDRADIVRRAIGGEHSVSSLAAHYPMSFAAVQKHVSVLEQARLITKRKRGREQLVRTNIDSIRAAQALLDRFEEIWKSRIDRIGEILAETDQGARE